MAIFNIIIDQGTTYKTPFSILEIDGTAKDITGAIVRSQMRKSPRSATAINFTAIIEDAVNGKVSMSLTANETSAIKPGRYVYDYEIEFLDGTVERVLEGQVTITPEITK